MPLPFDQLMRDLAAYLRTPLGHEREVYSLSVPLPGGRQQEVCATIRTTDERREIIDFVSTVGSKQGDIDPWLLLRLNGQANFSRVTISGEMIFVVASQMLATAQPEEVLLMLREVATFADQIEQGFFGTDTF